jgi:hypothetical protein
MASYNKNLIHENGVRIAEVESCGQKFQTPTTALSDNEYKNIEELRHPDNGFPDLQQPVVETRQVWDSDRLKKLSEEKSYWNSRRDNAKKMLSEFRKRIHFYRPEVEEMSNNGEEISLKSAKRITAFALDLDFDWIPVHDTSVDSSPKEFKKRILEIQDIIDDVESDKELVPILSIKTEAGELKRKLQIASELGFDIIAIKTGAVKGNRDRLSTIEEFSQSKLGDVMLYAANNYRMKNTDSTKRVSIRAILPRFGFDMVSYRKFKGGGPPGEAEDVKWYDQTEGRYHKVGNIVDEDKEDIETPYCNGECCDGSDAAKIYRDFRRSGKVRPKAWLHDVVSHYEEMKRLRDSAENNWADKYIRNRDKLKEMYVELEPNP